MQVRVGINVRGKPGMIVDRPFGSGDYVMIHFLEPVLLARDATEPVPADSCILYTPDAPTYIHSGDRGILNTYLHVSAGLVEPGLAQCPVPTNTVLSLHSTGWILPLLGRVQREWLERDQHWETALRLVMTDLLLHLARNLATSTAAPVSRHAERLKQIRLRVLSAPCEPWTVPAMADLAHLKEAQFTVLYKHLFGRPPCTI